MSMFPLTPMSVCLEELLEIYVIEQYGLIMITDWEESVSVTLM